MQERLYKLLGFLNYQQSLSPLFGYQIELIMWRKQHSAVLICHHNGFTRKYVFDLDSETFDTTFKFFQGELEEFLNSEHKLKTIKPHNNA